MSSEELEERFVNKMIEMTEERMGKIIQCLNDHTFEMWCKKLWDAQDIPPDMDGYNRSMSIMIVLKKSLLLRMATENREYDRSRMQQQLSLLSLILNPGALAQLASLPIDDDDINESSSDEI